MLRIVYVCILRLHPSYFRKRFADEMLSIFDQETGRLSAVKLVADGILSLLRQWTIRPEFWQEPDFKIASESVPVFHTLDDAELSRGTWFKGITLSAVLFCVFWLAIVFGQNAIPQGGAAIVQKYGLAVLSPKFDPNNFQSAPSPVFPPQLTDKPSAPLPSFEAASIKPYRGGVGVVLWGNINPPSGPVDRIALIGRTTKQLIELAYDIQDSQLSAVPSRISSKRFDIDAKVEDSIVADAVARKLTRSQQLDQVRLMLQSLLADRFKLKVHHESKELPVYALVVAKSGLRLTPSTVAPGPSPKLPAPPAGEATFVVFGPISIFADTISRMPEFDGRVVTDATGLKGDYFWTFHWTPESPAGLSGNAPQADSSVLSIFTAIQEQLGLKVESRKGPVDVIVIDHVEEPSPN